MKQAKLIISEGPSGMCPVQAEGTINGLPFYFRSRGEHWSLRVAKKKGGDVFANSAWFYEEPYLIPDTFAAGYASKEECLAFIEKAASIFVNEKH